MTGIPALVTFRGLARSDALETAIRERVGWLERFYDGIIGYRVLVEAPHRHRHRQGGGCFRVRIEVTVPRRPSLVVSHRPSPLGPPMDVEAEEHRKASDIDAARRDAHVAVREAFSVARRRLLDLSHPRHDSNKTRGVPAPGPAGEILSSAEGPAPGGDHV
jgi:hypothetical protein